MSKNKILVAAFVASIIASFAFSLTHSLPFGDSGGGGFDGIMKALLLFL